MSPAALKALFAGSINQTYNYYVDPSSGSDSNGGTRSAPFLTVAHGLSTATTGQSVGVKCGTTTRITSSLTTTLSNIRVGSYGVGAKPIISGGKLVATWTATSGGTYSASLTSAPAGTPGMVVAGTQALTKGASSTTLTTNQWFWVSNLLYINLGGTNPNGVTVEVASLSTAMVFLTASQVAKVQGLDFRFCIDHSLAFSGVASLLVDSCNFQWTCFSANSGNLLIQYITGGGRVVRSTFDQLANDGVWVHSSPNIEIGYCTFTNIGWLTGDVQTDGIQIEDSFDSSPSSAGLWIHDNTITVGAASPKGCIIYNHWSQQGGTPGGIIENNTLIGGNYGVAAAASNLVVRNNVMLNQVAGFGGAVHVDIAGNSITNVKIYKNLMVNGGQMGIVIQQTTNPRTGWVIANNTIIDAKIRGITIEAPADGNVVENNIVWNPTVTRTSGALYYNPGSTSAGFVSDYNDWGASGSVLIYWKGTTYTSLTTYSSAQSQDTHSISADPLVTAPLYLLGTGSPAIDAGVVISGITDGYSGSAPDMGYVP